MPAFAGMMKPGVFADMTAAWSVSQDGDMHISLLIRIAVIAALVVVAVVALWFAFRRRQRGPAPLVAARYVQLREGWYQIDMRVINRAPFALGGVSLRCLRPRRARLMAPVKSVSTKYYDFQIWSDPESDKPEKSIPLDFVVAPHEAREGGTSPGSEAHRTAWLFLPGKKPPAEVTLELTLRDARGKLHRYEVAATPQQQG
jgi:hypothetical protein